MDLKAQVAKATDFLENLDKEEELTGALLFTSANTNDKYAQVYLFSKFGSCTGNTINKSSDITSHYTEANYSIQDHWAIKPLQYTLSGLIGEIVYTPPNNWKTYVQQYTDYIKPLTILSPTLDSYTQSALNTVQAVENSYNRYKNLLTQSFQSFTGTQSVKSTNQQYVYNQMNNLVDNRQLCSVYTPYGTFDNLAIISVNLSQSSDSKYKSNIEITFQQWRDVETQSRKATKKELAEWNAIQQAGETNNGIASDKELDNASKQSTLKKMVNQGISLFDALGR